MKKKILDPPPLDEEELELSEWLKNVSEDELRKLKDPDFQKTKQKAEAIARNTLRKKPVNVRLFENDIEALKSIASRDGLPYQTLLSSIIHKYVNGTLVPQRYNH